MQITVTENACRRIAELLKDEPTGMFFRISVEGGGCSGFSYNFTITNTPTDGDYVHNQENIAIAIDKISQPFLDNCNIDFVEELVGASFKITNPNASAKCGCGNSFSL